MSKTLKIFAYGSLLYKESLLKTVPSARNIFPCKLYGFVRVFNFPSFDRLCEKTSIPCAVLNVEKSEWNQFINGICFEMDENCFEDLKYRERGYEIVQVEIKDYYDETKVSKAYFFRALHFEAHNYQSQSEKQKEYLNWCINGCSEFGEQFVEEFKKTTFIGKKTLEELGI